MPFTLAHPVVALPLRRRLGRLGSTPALAIGSMIPDLAYFVPLGVSGSESHSVTGLLWFCVPAGLVAWVAYHALVRPFALALAPVAIAARLGPGTSVQVSWSDLLCAAVSVAVAASTHVAWDSFTHSTGAAVQALAVLRRPVPLVPGYTPFVFTILQHGSTVLGLSVLAYWGIVWFRRAKATHDVGSKRLQAWVRGLVIGALVLPSSVAGGLVLWVPFTSGDAPFAVLQNNLGRAIFSAGTVFLAVLMVAALAWRAWDARLEVRRSRQTRTWLSEAAGE